MLANVHVERERAVDYGRVCGFSVGDELPATYPHVLAFPLHLAVMTDARFPFGAIGLVHVANRITQHRPIRIGEPLQLWVRTSSLEDHPRGRTFSLLSEARSGDELVWEELSTMLHRSRSADRSSAREQPRNGPLLPVGTEWRLPGDLGRRYAAVSGDRNPIHLHALSARAFGFPRAIAHGMWTKARCLAALAEPGARGHGPRERGAAGWPDRGLPEAFSVDVRFRRPILLPATVGFASAAEGDRVSFCVREVAADTTHLEGQLEPIGQPGKQAGAAR
jgi:acyl dehydratase